MNTSNMNAAPRALEGRVALVTGGARGIGRAIGLHLADLGAAVGVLDLKKELAEEAVAELASKGQKGMAFGGNVAERDTLMDATAALKKAFGRFDILVSNAMWVRYGPIAELTPEMVRRMVGTGFESVIWGIQAAEAHMGEGGSVINIASAAAFLGLPRGLTYAGVKAGVLGLTRAAAVDLGPRGIRVNAICPGFTATEGVMVNVTPEMVQKRLARTPMNRVGVPEDVARVAGFLASDASGFVSGEYIKVDGGATFAHL
ncbi:SDR family oxidoreductase [Ramlibacter sp. 2FC]|uniref:SDR family NAD(P)-dependent oxidoreductase n=1 Tax=Ramlibacter sp. 2FC TaxID=2502188 RepID=UPI00201E18A2|nr:SDR family oxidoreductase [Ramlibacter sp. 2FC]